MELQLNVEDQSNPDDVRYVENQLYAYNLPFTGEDQFRPLNIFVRSPDGKILAGLLGVTFWGWLHVDVLWVDAGLRGGGWGMRIMHAAEQEARSRGCMRVNLETHDFQALDFYQKLGYTLFGQLDDFPAGHRKYFLAKLLG